MEVLEINNVELYGKQVDKVDKFDIIKKIHDFKRATIKGSAGSNELYLIDDTDKGIHNSWSGWRICNLEPVYEEEDRWKENPQGEYIKETIKKIVSYKTVTNDSLEDFVKEHQEEVQQWFDTYIDKKEYDKKLKEKQKWCEDNFNHYYEVEFHEPKQGKIYLENKNSHECILVESDKYGFYIEVDDLCFCGGNKSMLYSIIEYIFNNRNLFSDFKQLKEGYIFNNQYYENLEDILSDIEDYIRNNRLWGKFMNDGLTLEDFNKEE